MSEPADIPVLDDLIERGIEITLSDLGLDDDPPLRVKDVMAADLAFDAADAAPVRVAAATHAAVGVGADVADRYGAAPASRDPLADNPALEQAVRRILDEHMELAWQEIRFAIQQHLDRS